MLGIFAKLNEPGGKHWLVFLFNLKRSSVLLDLFLYFVQFLPKTSLYFMVFEFFEIIFQWTCLIINNLSIIYDLFITYLLRNNYEYYMGIYH
jgi:hypothetical protein